jgi:hypothetical protein
MTSNTNTISHYYDLVNLQVVAETFLINKEEKLITW